MWYFILVSISKCMHYDQTQVNLRGSKFVFLMEFSALLLRIY
jgi:hypothetical protein